MEKLYVHKHSPGDGVHYITENFRVFPNGNFQLGDSSEGCILLSTHLVLTNNGVTQSIVDIWNMVYPDDPMSDADFTQIVYCALDFTEKFNPKDPVNIGLVLNDLKSMGCFDLASHVEALLF